MTRRIAGCVPSLWMSHFSKCSSGPAFMTMSGGWMIGPAFMSAPDSASPQGSIAPGKARPMTLERTIGRGQRKDAGRQVLAAGRDLHLMRAVLARQPGQSAGLREGTAGHGCRTARPCWRGGRNRTFPAAGTRPAPRQGAARAARQCRPARRPASDKRSARPRHRRADVGGDQLEGRRVLASKVLELDGRPAAQWLAAASRSRRHIRT